MILTNKKIIIYNSNYLQKKSITPKLTEETIFPHSFVFYLRAQSSSNATALSHHPYQKKRPASTANKTDCCTTAATNAATRVISTSLHGRARATTENHRALSQTACAFSCCLLDRNAKEKDLLYFVEKKRCVCVCVCVCVGGGEFFSMVGRNFQLRWWRF